MSPEFPKSADVAASILFLGSGFSADAKNLRNENLLTGDGLLKYLASIAGANAADYDLQTIADELKARPGLNVYQILYEQFTVKQLTDVQREVLKLPWKRIYTTNYDDAVEFGLHQEKITAASFNYDDDKPRKLPNGSVIHLHGVIRRATEANVLEQLVMSEGTYVRQHFEKSPWFDEFSRDLRFCDACFFLGYRLRDHHIAALLMQNASAREKTYFVTRAPVDVIFENRIRNYGRVLPIGIDGFAKNAQSLPRAVAATDPNSLKAFQFLDPFKDKKTLAPPTAVEVLNLVTFGTFNYQRCLSSLPHPSYVVPRQRSANQALSQLDKVRCLLVHSRLGNGKTIFLYILAHKLAEKNYRCFWCRSEAIVSQAEIELLKSMGRVAVFFDSYNTAIDVIEQLSALSSEARFIVAARSGVQEVRLHEIQSRLPTPLGRISLNELDRADIEDFKQLLDQSGVGTFELGRVISNCRDVREIVVSLYDNRQIRERVKLALAPLLQDQSFKRVFVASHLLRWAGQDVDPAFLRAVTGCDAYAELARFREFAADLFSLDDDVIQVRSAMFSEYVIQNHLQSADIVEAAHNIIVEAVKRKIERRYQAVLSTLMRYTILERALRNDPLRNSLLVTLFEKLRRDIDVNDEPLFWLQYSILMTSSGDMNAAESFIETAYARAAIIPGFQTFQIDTYALRLLLLVEQQDKTSSRVVRFDQLVDKLDRAREMISDQSRRGHAIEVLEEIEPFIDMRRSALGKAEAVTLTYHLSLLIDGLERLSPDERAQTGADTIRGSLVRAKDRLLR